jgi:Cellulase (glycosyl hydrolase family 5)
MLIRKSIALVALICGFSLSVSAVTYDSTYWAPPLTVQGTKIVNAKGYVVQLKGFATMGAYPDITQAQIVHFKKDWNITLLRLPLLTSDCNCPRAICWTVGNIAINAANTPYITAVDSIVKWCEDNHIYVLFDGWHEGGQGNTVGNFSSTVAAWGLMATRYKNQDNLLWEIFNEPHNVTWTAWVPMVQQLIDTIRARNPVSKVIVAGTANWCQQADVKTLKIARDQVIYAWHPYSTVYGSIGATTWDSKFGYIMSTGVAPIMNTEWGFTSASDSANYGTQLIQYMKNLGASWTGWIYSSTWGPPMLTSLNVAAATEVRNPSGNLMFKAYHDTMSVVSFTGVKKPAAGAVSGKNISIDNSTIRFNCAETSPVTLSIYSLNGNCIGTLIDRTLTKGSHSIRWNAQNGHTVGMAPGLYTVRLKIKDREYFGQLNNLR